MYDLTGFFFLLYLFFLVLLASRYDVLVDVVPEIKWLAEAKYKNLKIIVQIDKTITAEIASEIEFKRRHKAQGSLRIVTDRGLQVPFF